MNKLKKIISVLTMATILSVGGICAASDSSDLAAQQKTAEVFIQAIDGDKNIPAYNIFNKDFSDELKAQINEKAYVELQNQVENNFGKLKEVKFFAYERYDQGDRITYLASFSNQDLVSIQLSFNKEQKVIEYSLVPLAVEENK